jgi:hypothetical protein
MTKTTARFDIVAWNLFGICDLLFVIYSVFLSSRTTAGRKDLTINPADSGNPVKRM